MNPILFAKVTQINDETFRLKTQSLLLTYKNNGENKRYRTKTKFGDPTDTNNQENRKINEVDSLNRNESPKNIYNSPKSNKKYSITKTKRFALSPNSPSGNKQNEPKKLKIKMKNNFEAPHYAKMQRKCKRRETLAVPVKDEFIEVPPTGMSVPILASKLSCTAADLVKFLFKKGFMVQLNQQLDRAVIEMVCESKNIKILDTKDEYHIGFKTVRPQNSCDNDSKHLQYRPPIVTVMGHVDHGKTTLLDYIRESNVASGESGGITQGIGAYDVKVTNSSGSDNGVDRICFIDTPGHEAFSSMRARGAQVTDIALIVVAADDGVGDQTLEVIQHAKAVATPIVVAINKIDKPDADQERVKSELAEAGLLLEGWGGNVSNVPVSAKYGTGIKDLNEILLLEADLLELTADPSQKAQGTVIESSLDKSRGTVATVIIQSGTLRVGDVMQTGSCYGKVRALYKNWGMSVNDSGPSSVVHLLGLNSLPKAGHIFRVFSSDHDARKHTKSCAKEVNTVKIVSFIGYLFSGKTQAHIINLVLKVDVTGSIDAIVAALNLLPQEKVILRYIMTGVGEITESDIELAAPSKGIIVGFNLKRPEALISIAKNKGVEIRLYKIIYEMVDDIKLIMESKLEPLLEKIPSGKAEVKAIFGGGNQGKVAGCLILQGRISVGETCLVRRGKKNLHEGALRSLRRSKDKVESIEAGNECGIDVDGFKDWEVGDLIDCYRIVSRRCTLEEANTEI